MDLKEVLRKERFTAKIPQPKPSSQEVREVGIKNAIGELEKATPKQILERVRTDNPRLRISRRTLFRDLKALLNKKLIDKQWNQEEGEFYTVIQQPDQPIWELIDDLILWTDSFAEEMISLKKAWEEAAMEKKRLDLEASGVISFDTMERVVKDIEVKIKKVETKVHNMSGWKPKPNPETPWTPEEMREREEASRIESGVCSECGGIDFETRDERQFCAKCGTERKS